MHGTVRQGQGRQLGRRSRDADRWGPARDPEANRIFDANRDQLKDPDKIFPGQVLKIPR